MASDASGMNDERRDADMAAPMRGDPRTDSARTAEAAAAALGYEAADPALQAPCWAEAMLATKRSLR